MGGGSATKKQVIREKSKSSSRNSGGSKLSDLSVEFQAEEMKDREDEV